MHRVTRALVLAFVVSLACEPAAGAAVQEQAADRGWRDQRATLRLPGWYPRLRDKFNPAHGEWWTEVVAQAAERALVESFEQLLGGGTSTGTMFEVQTSFRGSTRLEPESSELLPLREGPTLRVDRWNSHPLPLVGDALEEDLKAWLDPLQADPSARVQVQVVESTQREQRRFETVVELRVSGQVEGKQRQDNLRWRLVWVVPSGSQGPLLDELHLVDFERVLLHAPLFAELTRPLLDGGRFEAEDLMLGAPEQKERADKSVGFALIHLGMHGMAVGDLDGNGCLDLYVGTQAGRPNALFLQESDGRLREVSVQAGVDLLDDTAGVVIVDIDGNGARDLVLAVRNGVLVLYNEGPCRFERRQFMACKGAEQVYSVSAADADGDGDLDLYATRYVQGGVVGGVPTPYHDAHNGASNAYFRNDEGSFVDATEEVGLDQGNDRFSLASIWEDLDSDGDLDLYVTNDFGMNNDYRNEGGKFTDVAVHSGGADMAAGMGISVADVELDGDLDLYISNMFSAAGSRITPQAKFMPQAPLELRAGYARHARGNTLLVSRGDGTFEDASVRAGVASAGWAWGAMFTDFENDGLPDLLVPNGFVTTEDERDLESFFWREVIGASPTDPPADQSYKQAWVGVTMMSQDEGLSWNGRERNYAFSNLGQLRFADLSSAAGLDFLDDARMVCVADWDGDGGADLWLRNRTAPTLRFLHNRAPERGHWIAFDLVGAAGARHAVGSLVTVESGDRSLLRRLYAGEGFLGGSCHRLHFGLASMGEPVRVRVRWTDGSEEVFESLDVNRVWVLEQGDPVARALAARPQATLAELSADPLPTTLGEPLDRLPLLDKLPFSNFPLHSFSGQPTKVADFRGASLFLPIWATWNPASQEALADLARGQGALKQAGVKIWPLAFDTVRAESAARERVTELGLELAGGRLDPAGQIILEAALLDMLGNFQNPGMPLGLLFDADGALSVIYFGTFDPERIAEDARRLESARAEPDSRWTTVLTGGFWVSRRPARNLAYLQRMYGRAGYNELAREMNTEAKKRAARQKARKEERALQGEAKR